MQFAQCASSLLKQLPIKSEIILLAKNPLQKDILDQLTQLKTPVRSIVSEEAHQQADLDNAVDMAQGEILFIISDEILGTSALVRRLIFSYTEATNNRQTPYIGAVVPASNASPSRSRINPPQGLRETDSEAVQTWMDQQELEATAKSKVLVLGSMLDSCFLTTKELYTQVNGLDTSLPTNLERGTEFLVKLLHAGYYSIVAGNTYMYVPQKTIKYAPIIKKKGEHLEQRLAILYAVSLKDEERTELFLSSLRKSSALADEIFILDNQSSVNIFRLITEAQLLGKVTKYKKIFQPHNRKRDYNVLLGLARQASTIDWVIVLEDDETIEHSVTRQDLEKLMSPMNEQVCGYTCNEYYHWNDKENWRIDGLWGSALSLRISRVLPNLFLVEEDMADVAYVPPLPSECVRASHVRIHSYNLLRKEWREQQKAELELIAPHNSWSYLTDEHDVKLLDYRRATVSVYTPTKESEDIIPWIDHVRSWANEVIIGLDGEGSPAYIAELEQYGVTVVPCTMGTSYADGRNHIIKHCTADYILQLDIDERLEKP